MLFAATGLSTQIQNNHIRSALLLAGFPILLVLMAGAFFGGLDLMYQNGMGPAAAGFDLARAGAAALRGMADFGPVAVLLAAAWFAVAFFLQGNMIRMAADSRPVTRAEMPKIYNMLENLCISRGIPMPAFEIIDSPALNAFASGLNDKTWRITLTRGIVEALEDDELEAVIAHELSHIINRDARLLVIAVIFTGMIGFLAQMTYRSLVYGRRRSYYARSARRQDGRQAGVVLLALLVLAVGYVFAIAIRFALSRRREHLADLGAVTLTKNPGAMMRALMRIRGRDTVAGMPDEVQQMCIENSHSFLGFFATHPPIEDRLKVISDSTRTEIPVLPVSLRRAPKRPLEQDGPWGRRA